MQQYISEPSQQLDGTYVVSRWNEITQQYDVIEKGYPIEELSKMRAHQLNEEHHYDVYEYEHQNELISKYHDYALSEDTQQRNAAREFFMRFPYQREVCEDILSSLK